MRRLNLPGFRGGKPTAERRCEAITKVGQQCANHALVGDTLCRAHRIQADAKVELEAEALQFVHTSPEAPAKVDRSLPPPRTAAMIKHDLHWVLDVRPAPSDMWRNTYVEEGTPLDDGRVPAEDDGRNDPVVVSLDQPSPDHFILDGRWAAWVKVSRYELEQRMDAAQQAGANAILPPKEDPEVEAVDAAYGTGTRRKPVGRIKNRRSIAQLLFPSINVRSLDPLDPRQKILSRAKSDPEFLLAELARRGKTLRAAEVAHLLPASYFQQAVRNEVARENASRARAAEMSRAADEARDLAIEFEIEKGEAPSNVDTPAVVTTEWDNFVRERSGGTE